jgi:transcriptional regulator with XRE-family HTH domain
MLPLSSTILFEGIIVATYIMELDNMSIAARLSKLRKTKGLTQQALAEAIGLHVTQIKRYEAGTSQPSLEAIKKIAQTLRVTTDSLIFEDHELEADADLALQFQAIANMPPEQQSVVKQLLEGMIIKYEAARWSSQTK